MDGAKLTQPRHRELPRVPRTWCQFWQMDKGNLCLLSSSTLFSPQSICVLRFKRQKPLFTIPSSLCKPMQLGYFPPESAIYLLLSNNWAMESNINNWITTFLMDWLLVPYKGQAELWPSCLINSTFIWSWSVNGPQNLSPCSLFFFSVKQWFYCFSTIHTFMQPGTLQSVPFIFFFCHMKGQMLLGGLPRPAVRLIYLTQTLTFTWEGHISSKW